jgi:hypothetical protein
MNGADGMRPAPFTLAATDGRGELLRESMGGGSWGLAVALLNVHTPSKNPRQTTMIHAYIAYFLVGESSRVRLFPAQISIVVMVVVRL